METLPTNRSLPSRPLKELLSISLASAQASQLSLAVANSPQAYPIRAMLREHGHDAAIEVLAQVLVQADVATGGAGEPKVCELWAAMLLDKFQHRSVEAFVLAIRKGLTGGKIFGRLSVPQISEWLDLYEADTLNGIESEYATHKFTGDNLGAEYLDRLEHDATSKDRTIGAQGRLIDELRRKLEVPKP